MIVIFYLQIIYFSFLFLFFFSFVTFHLNIVKNSLTFPNELARFEHEHVSTIFKVMLVAIVCARVTFSKRSEENET